jgi:hypothetical protein
MENLCSAELPPYEDKPCEPDRRRVVSTISMGAAVSSGQLMHAKTIFNWFGKSPQQRSDILMAEAEQFLQVHPGYEYDTWKYEDGKAGERTIFLIFKKKIDGRITL